MKKFAISLILVVGAMMLNSTASSAAILSDLTGTRTAVYDNQILAGGAWDNNFTISWNIIKENGVYTYEYSWQGTASGASELSHWILQVTDNSENDDFWNFEGDLGKIEGIELFGQSPSNPGIPGDIYGWKFNSDTDGSLSFQTYKEPVWGDFYAKDGKTGSQDNYAYNSKFGIIPTGAEADYLGWIARPNGGVIPEPASMLLLGSGLIGLAGLRKRKV